MLKKTPASQSGTNKKDPSDPSEKTSLGSEGGKIKKVIGLKTRGFKFKKKKFHFFFK